LTQPVARLGDTLTHGANLISASTSRNVDGIGVARLGDSVYCPIHGLNQIISVNTKVNTDNQPTAQVSAVAECGAVVISGSPTVSEG